MKFSKLGTLAAFGIALVMSCAGLLVPSAASAAPVDFTYQAIHNWHSDMCMSGYAGFGVRQVPCVDSSFQQWREVPTTDGYVQFLDSFAGFCLEIMNAAQGNNMPLGFNVCTGADHQQFKKVNAPIGGGFYQLVARHSGKCLTIQSESLEQGAQLVQYECSPDSPQIDPIGAGYWDTF
jgi:hypothetical protein